MTPRVRRAILGVALLGLAGCGKETPQTSRGEGPAYQGPLVVVPEPGGPFVRSFNPFRAEPLWGSGGAIYEPLLIFNAATGNYVPWLATDYAWSANNSNLTFTLRPEVKWADGKPFTAEDVAFTFDLLRRYPTLDVNRVWEFLGKVEVGDPTHVTFVFKRVFTPGLAYVGQLYIVAAHKWGPVKNPISFPDEEPVGTGPFNRVLKVEERALELGKNESYWQPGKPQVPAVRVERYATNEETLAALVAGRVDWGGIFIKDVEKAFVAGDPTRGYWFPPYGDAVFLHLNTTKKPFDDARVRKALSRALDRKWMVKEALDGHAVPMDATGLPESYRKWKDQAISADSRWTGRDVAGAGSALDQLGLKVGPDGTRMAQGTRMTYELDVPAEWTDWVAAARIAAANFRDIGLEVQLRPLPVDDWRDRMRRGAFAMTMGPGERGPTPYQLYRGLLSRQTVVPLGQPAASNFGRFADDEATGLVGQIEKTSDGRDLKRIVARLQAIFDERAPTIPLFSNPSWGEFSRKRFKGFPDKLNPYAPLAPHQNRYPVLVLVELTPS